MSINFTGAAFTEAEGANKNQNVMFRNFTSLCVTKETQGNREDT